LGKAKHRCTDDAPTHSFGWETLIGNYRLIRQLLIVSGNTKICELFFGLCGHSIGYQVVRAAVLEHGWSLGIQIFV
jgi:hypothetical protein